MFSLILVSGKTMLLWFHRKNHQCGVCYLSRFSRYFKGAGVASNLAGQHESYLKERLEKYKLARCNTRLYQSLRDNLQMMRSLH